VGIITPSIVSTASFLSPPLPPTLSVVESEAQNGYSSDVGTGPWWGSDVFIWGEVVDACVDMLH